MAYNSLNSQTAQSIISQINQWLIKKSLISPDHQRWYIGITDDPERRRKEHLRNSKKEKFDVKHFHFWHAKTKRIARSIESWGHHLGMLDSDLEGNTNDDSVFVYVYKKYPLLKPKRPSK
ncbi:GIY-YIG nuclease family protein [Flectobacillus roseus]|jgi:hypothetical protein|uniref:GIY-YIG domain-containing protein n=1 Tax=Flectobacillus roseus TaxID=502259 RepID=A0ABT6Y367_9BACT|nr:GIY-YIG nuclease family protein [Flectobacillus roseus]MDI9858017.1 hypothetical protein [Flectobacillus roseus]